MTNKITLLPPNVANKIAAGEVVQRPESVLKELLENSIDAGAKQIDVFIKDAGKVLIQVVDDGSGMNEADAMLSIERHATSKIKTIDDLYEIKSFGFRGEALSSIASVSIFELKTEQYDDELGTSIRIGEDGEVISEKGSFSKGTSIAVKNLFYNTPARRNFLKTNATELKHLIETFKRAALSNSNISFRFYNEDDLIYNFKSDNLSNRVAQVFEENILNSLLEVNEKTEFIELNGFVAKPSFLRRNRGDQYLFVNNRPVTNKTINHAVFTAFENILEKGDYPFFVLFLTIDPIRTDVNVHPSKLEIKFDNEKDIYSFVQAVIRKSIGSYDLVPSMRFDTPQNDEEKIRFNTQQDTTKRDFSDRPVNNSSMNDGYSDSDIDLLFQSLNNSVNAGRNPEDTSHPFEEAPKEVLHSSHEHVENPGTNSSFIVALHNKYILSQIKSGLMIIDMHVAHERILYEKALTALETEMPFSQQLLFSQKLKVDAGEYQLLQELKEHLIKLGFELKFHNNFYLTILGVPGDVKVGAEIETLYEILNEYKKNQIEKKLDVIHNVAASYSCKTAIKAGDKLSEMELRQLVDQLFATSMPYVCPHGRPIVIKISLSEFDRRFGRT